MVQEIPEDGEAAGGPERIDSTEEPPLQAMYRHEFQVSTTPFQVVLNLLRLISRTNQQSSPLSLLLIQIFHPVFQEFLDRIKKPYIRA